MRLLPVSEINVDHSKTKEVEEIMKSTFRLITFSREHYADDLLNTYLSSTTSLKELLSIKNAQMEAQDDEEAEEYLVNLKETLLYVTNEIENQVDFTNEVQLFQLFRSTSPDSHKTHPNRYRDKLVQIGAYLCPDPKLVPSLVSELLYNMNSIKNPIIKSIYFHHELIRIHPFADGNGRTTRIADNWILMYNLYPPVFIRDNDDKAMYINTLSKSFALLDKTPLKWNAETLSFFEQEIERLRFNCQFVFDEVKKIGEKRLKTK
ncbi:MAG: Fic family protein [Algicola sp.]|nr:Fic family protein [Algicola sp.]